MTGFRTHKDRLQGKTLHKKISDEFFNGDRSEGAVGNHLRGKWVDVLKLLDREKQLGNKAIEIILKREDGKIRFEGIDGDNYAVRIKVEGQSNASWTIQDETNLLYGLRQRLTDLATHLRHRHDQFDCEYRKLYWKDEILNWKGFLASQGTITVSENSDGRRSCSF